MSDNLPESSVSYQVYDNDSGKLIDVTGTMQAAAYRAMQQIYAGSVVIAMNIKAIKDQKLYLAVQNHRGKYYTSWRNFVESELSPVGIGYATANRYYRVADVFDNLLTRNIAIEGNDSWRSAAPSNMLEISKLSELTRLPDEQINQLNDTDELTLDDGRTFTLGQLMEMSHRQLISERNNFRKDSESLSERLALAEDQLRDRNERLEKLSNEEQAAKMVVELTERLDKLETKMIALENADSELDRADCKINAAFQILKSIPRTDDDRINTKNRILLSAVIHRANNLLYDQGFSFIDPATVNSDIPDGDDE